MMGVREDVVCEGVICDSVMCEGGNECDKVSVKSEGVKEV